VSWHFRGPLQLKQFAFYSPGSEANKRDLKPNALQHRHGHQHFHARDREIVEVQEAQVLEEKRAVGDIVEATIDGQVVSWTNGYAGPGTAFTSAVGAGYPVDGVAPSATYPAPSSQPSMNAGLGNWGRHAYYNANTQTADGLVFLNHNGGQGSGVFDEYVSSLFPTSCNKLTRLRTWGNSLSYASPDGTTGSASPQTLGDTMIGDNVEIVIMTDKPCSSGDCGTVRPGTVAYRKSISTHGRSLACNCALTVHKMASTGPPRCSSSSSPCH
jgi:hypothetical protein